MSTRGSAEGADSELERLVKVDEIVTAAQQQARSGHEVDVELIADQHPEIRSELLAALRGFASLERSVDREALDVSMPGAIGPYTVVREIGRGGMGVVYEAEDRSLDRRVAIKLLPERISSSSDFVERFRREAHAAARLEHPGVVPVYGVGDADGQHYYAMQFVDGYGLDGLIRIFAATREGGEVPDGSKDSGRQRRFARALAAGRLDRFGVGSEDPSDPEDADDDGARPTLGRAYHRNVARIGLRAAEALGHAHARGVLHRDVKPANVLLDRGGRVLITDFGLAKLDESEDLTREGDFVGTLRYMAPEQFSGHAEPRSDVYGLGLVLYELLTLERAVRGDSRAELVNELLHVVPRSPDAVRPEVPQDLARIVMKAVAKLPEHRYRTAEAMAADLRAFLDGQPIAARAPSTLYLARLAVNRSRGPFIAVAVLVAALVVGAAIYVLELKDSTRREAGLAYRANLAAAAASLMSDDTPAARSRLDGCPEDLRGWEWRHLSASVDQSVREIARIGHPIERLAFEGDRLVVSHRTGVTIFEDGEAVEEVMLPGGRVSGSKLVVAYRVGESWLSLDFRTGLWRSPLGGAPGGTVPEEREDEFRNLTLPRAVNASAVTPDGEHIVVVERAGRLLLVDTDTLQIERAAITGQSRVLHVGLSPDGGTAYVGSTDGLVKAWDLETLKSRVILAADTAVTCLAVHPTGGLIAVGSSDHSVQLLAPDGTPRGRLLGHTGKPTAVAFSADGRLIATVGGERRLKVWDLESREVLQSLSGLSRVTDHVCFTPDGRGVISANNAGIVQEWSVEVGGGRAWIRGHHSDVAALDHTSDGARFATGARDGSIRVHDAASLRLDLFLPGHSTEINGLAWHRGDGALLAVERGGVVRDWSIPDGRVRWELKMEGVVSEPEILPGERAALVSSGGDIMIVGLEDGARLAAKRDEEHGYRSVTLTADANSLLVGDLSGDLVVLDSSTLEEKRRVRGLHEQEISAIIVDPERRQVITSSLDGSIAFADEDSFEVRRRTRAGAESLTWQSDGVEHLALSPDGRVLVAGTHAWLVRVIDPGSGEFVLDLTGHDDWVRRVQFSPGGESLVSSCSHSSVRVWDTSASDWRVSRVEERLDLEDAARSRIESRLGARLGDPSQALEQLEVLDARGSAGHAALERAERAVLHQFLAGDPMRSLERMALVDEREITARAAMQYVRGWNQRRGSTYETYRLMAVANARIEEHGEALEHARFAAELEPERAGADPVLLAARARAHQLAGDEAKSERCAGAARRSEAFDAVDRRTSEILLALIGS
ncbi:MAG: protein kinase [Planctomycetota bacterium]|nr:protein kinase [Planctomycetota bacterium]